MPGITLMTDFGINDGTVGVVKRVSGEICPKAQISNIVSNVVACLGVKAGDGIEISDRYSFDVCTVKFQHQKEKRK